MTTLTSTPNGVLLTHPPYNDPIVINQGVTITDNASGGNGIAAYSPYPGIWTISNAGMVAAAGTNGAAIYLAYGGVVTNQSSGVIGSISSNLSAIYILGDAGTVTNFGTINAGVWLQSGGAVTNQTGGRIISRSTSGGYGVGLNAGGTVTNAGTISGLLLGIDESQGGGTVINQLGGTIAGHYAGVLMGFTDKAGPGGRYVTNQAGGTIIGYTGVLAGGAVATVTNAGVIEGTVAGTFSNGGITLVVGAGVSMSPGGTVTNQSGGTITGASYGVYIGGGAGTVFNSGSIAGNSGAGVGLMAGGFVSNATTRSIFSTQRSGIYITGAGGTVVNDGSIYGSGAGIGIKLGAGGYVSNAPTGVIISAEHSGISVNGGAGTVVNAGVVANPGTSGIGGVVLLSGGFVSNAATGTITSARHNGVYVNGAAGTVINGGSLLSSFTNAPVWLADAGAVTNLSSGTISTTMGNDIYISGGSGTVINFGIIQTLSTIHAAVNLARTGYISNASTGTISSNAFGAANAFGGVVTVVNAGLITSNAANRQPTSDGVFLGKGGIVVNQSTGTIGGGANGILVTGGVGSITNVGTIAGGTFAVNLASGFANRLIIDPGATFVGTVDGGNTIGASTVSTLELASRASIGTLTSLGSKYIDFAQIVIDNGATWTLPSVPAGYAITDLGTLINAGAFASPITLTAGGYFRNASGATIVGSGSAAVRAGAGATVVNAGLIDPANYGVYLPDGGSVTNVSNGTIVGTTDGVKIAGGTGTVTNAGSIAGGTDAISLAAGFANRLVIDPLAVFTGTVTGGNTLGATAVSTLELASGATAGTLSSLVSKYVDFGQIIVDPGATWVLAGSNTLAAGITLTDNGTLVVAGSLANYGMIAGAVTLDAGAVLTNAAGGVIDNAAGIAMYSAVTSAGVSVINAGSITSGGANNGRAIDLLKGGYVSNAATGTIFSPQGVGIDITGAAGTIINAGSIAVGGTHGAVDLLMGGYVSNAATGTIISSGGVGVYITGDAGTVINIGSIAPGGTHTAVDLLMGGYVSNTGTITSVQQDGVRITGGAGTLINFGAIGNSGTPSDVGLDGGGTVTNAASGLITSNGGIGIYVDAASGGLVLNAGSITASLVGVVFEHGAGTLVNSGIITATSTLHSDLDLLAGGRVTNQAGGLIQDSGGSGIYVSGGSGTVVNASVIKGGAFGTGVHLKAGGYVGNAITGTISSPFFGVVVNGGSGTVVNAGTIAGSTDAVQFAAGFTNRLEIEPGAVFTGTVTGGNTIGATAVSTLELASGASSGTLIGLGTKYIDFAQVTIDAGASWTVQGTVQSGQAVAFAGAGSYLHLDNPDSVSGVITNFAAGDTIDLKGINPASVSYAAGTLNFTGGSFALALAAPGSVQATPSGDGADVTLLCFCANTQILTPTGERSVQDLAVGDLVTTQHGAARSIVWLGIGKVLATRGRRTAATPVIVRKGALADNVPNRDLRVTKGHAFHLDDVLIPVEFLVNHRSIEWDDRAQEVELYHIELATHDVLVANGAPAESYRDDGNRWLFRNANSGWDLPPQEPCAPVLTGGAIVDTVWRRLLERAGPRPGVPLTDDADLHLIVDGARLDIAERIKDVCVFHLPAPPSDLRIGSRAAAPAELGLARDPRVLGIALRRLVVRQRARFRVTEAHDARLADGFHAFEADNGFRWTDGDAAIPAELLAGFTGPLELVLHIGATTHYLADGSAQHAA